MSPQGLNCLQLKAIHTPKWHIRGGQFCTPSVARGMCSRADLSALPLRSVLRWGRGLGTSLGIGCIQAHYQDGMKPVVVEQPPPGPLPSLAGPPPRLWPPRVCPQAVAPLGLELWFLSSHLVKSQTKQLPASSLRALSPRAAEKQAGPFGHAP